MKAGVQEEPGGQDGHSRQGKQALLHQGKLHHLQACIICGNAGSWIPGTFTRFLRFLHNLTRFYTILRDFTLFYAIFTRFHAIFAIFTHFFPRHKMSYPRHLKLLCRPDHLFPYFIFPLQDYTKKFSVVCAGCKKSITPKKGEVLCGLVL